MGTYRQPAIIDNAAGLKQANAEISKFNEDLKSFAQSDLNLDIGDAFPKVKYQMYSFNFYGGYSTNIDSNIMVIYIKIH